MNLTLLIDLDDTLLPGSTKKFLPKYIAALAEFLDLPMPKEKIIEVIYESTYRALAESQIDVTIKERFDQIFYPALGTSFEAQEDRINVFYTEEFPKYSPVKEPDPQAVTLIETALKKEYRVAIATNPIFPRAATYQRLRWAGITPEKYPLEIVTTYEDFHFGKPNPLFYLELLAQLGWPETGFVLVGDSEIMDIKPAKALGIPSFWLNPASGEANIKETHAAGGLSQVHDWIQARNDEELQLNLNDFQHSLNILTANAAAIDTMLRNAPASIWDPTPQHKNWQVHEILCHLRDVDQEVHTPRLMAIRDQETPFLPAIDADVWAEERYYYGQDGRQALREFFQARKAFLELAANLPETASRKEIRHSIFGPTELDEIIRIAALHDSLHTRQIMDQIKQI